MPAVVDIGRLHARYHGGGPETAAMLDGALDELVRGGLDPAGFVLEHELLPADLAGAWAVVVDAVTFELRVEPSFARDAVVEQWAAELMKAVARAATDRRPDAGVIVYRTEGDAAVDALTRLAAGDLSRRRVWRQIGLLAGPADRPGPSEVAALLADRPSLAPGVILAAGDTVARLVDAGGWLAIAHAVARHIDSPVGPKHPTSGRDEGPHGRPTTSPPAAVRLEDGALAARLPAEAWRAATSAADHRELAALALALARPSLARDRTALDAVAEAGAGVGAGRPVRRPTAEASAPAPPAGGADRTTADPAPPGSSDTEHPVHTDWGGVFFLAHPLADLGVVDEIAALSDDPPAVLAAVVAAVTGAPRADAAVAFLSSGGGGPVAEPNEAPDVGPWCAALVRWVDERTVATPPLEPDLHPPGWPWRRPATIETAPGEITVTFALDDADLDVRRAGLDVDPGWVWWLATAVRFRYA